MRIERHVFGSFTGYTTLARSAGLLVDDARQLEGSSFSFGQTSDKGYLKGLRKNPAYFTRALRGGRRGLTRVLEGAPDDNGRPTLLMITAVVTQREWDSELCGDVGLLLDDAQVWYWEGGELHGIDRSYPLPSQGANRRSVPRVLALLSEVERQAGNSRHPIVVSASEFSPEDIRALEMLVPPAVRPQFTTACRSLSVTLPVTVNLLAAEADSQSVTFRAQTGLPLSPYAQALQGTSFASGGMPLAEIMAYRAFGRREQTAVLGATRPVETTVAPTPLPLVSRGPSRVMVSALILICLLIGGVAFFTGLTIGERRAAKTTHGSGQTPTPAPAPPANDAPRAPVEPSPVTQETSPATQTPAQASKVTPPRKNGVAATPAAPANPAGPSSLEVKLHADLKTAQEQRDQAEKLRKEAEEQRDRAYAERETLTNRLSQFMSNAATTKPINSEGDGRKSRSSQVRLAKALADRIIVDLARQKTLGERLGVLMAEAGALEEISRAVDAAPAFKGTTEADWLVAKGPDLHKLADLAELEAKIHKKNVAANGSKAAASEKDVKPEARRDAIQKVSRLANEIDDLAKTLPDQALHFKDTELRSRKKEFTDTVKRHREWVSEHEDKSKAEKGQKAGK